MASIARCRPYFTLYTSNLTLPLMAGLLGQEDKGGPARDDSIETRETRMNRVCEMRGSEPVTLYYSQLVEEKKGMEDLDRVANGRAVVSGTIGELEAIGKPLRAPRACVA